MKNETVYDSSEYPALPEKANAPRPSLGWVWVLLAAALLLLLAAFTSGCAPAIQRQYVEADAVTFNAVAPYQLRKIQDDNELSAEDKKIKSDTIESWRVRLVTAGAEWDEQFKRFTFKR